MGGSEAPAPVVAAAAAPAPKSKPSELPSDDDSEVGESSPESGGAPSSSEEVQETEPAASRKSGRARTMTAAGLDLLADGPQSPVAGTAVAAVKPPALRSVGPDVSDGRQQATLWLACGNLRGNDTTRGVITAG